MALYTACIKEFFSLGGTRISIMSRHTLNDGITRDPEIVAGRNYAIHCPEFAPPPKLIGDYCRRGLPWGEFAVRYLEHLRRPGVIGKVIGLAELASTQDLIVLCVECEPLFCHRRLFAEECKRLIPTLSIVIR